MADPSGKKPSGGGKKVRVPFRRNRGKRKRVTDVTHEAKQTDDFDVDSQRDERVVAKGDLSRHRTIIVGEENASVSSGLAPGVVIAMRGRYAEVDDGTRVWPCSVRRVLRTLCIEERNAVIVGDRVHFRPEAEKKGVVAEGVIEHVEPRTGVLQRRSGKRIHTIAANINQAIIVTCAREPRPKPNLIDRYIVAAHAGGMTPIICMNKMDLDEDGQAVLIIQRYASLGYETIHTCAIKGTGIEQLKGLLTDRSSVVTGQSGVGKSSLLNAVVPELKLRVGHVSEQIEKGRHTTTTATLMKLPFGGYVVDTPGIRTFDLSVIPREQYEAHFVEFVPLIPNCKYPDCSHTHETECAIKQAVTRGDVLPERYESYVQMYEDPGRQDV